MTFSNEHVMHVQLTKEAWQRLQAELAAAHERGLAAERARDIAAQGMPSTGSVFKGGSAADTARGSGASQMAAQDRAASQESRSEQDGGQGW